LTCGPPAGQATVGRVRLSGTVDAGGVGVAEVVALVASAGCGGEEPVAVGVSGLVGGGAGPYAWQCALCGGD
jgi:hypothetical protein